jgi:hypothetical protein
VEKRTISVGLAISIVVVLFAAMGIASAVFTQDSIVSGTGLVMIDKDFNTAPGDLNHNLVTRIHTHGCGDYDADQVVTLEVIDVYGSTGTFTRHNRSSIDFCEQAEMTYEPMTLTSGSMVLIDEESAPKWKQDLCIKNYQIGTAMTARYMNADYISKDIVSTVSCIEPYCINSRADPWSHRETAVPGVGLAKLDILSTVTGKSHVGVVSYGVPVLGISRPIAAIRVSEDYIGNFTMEKHMKVKIDKVPVPPCGSDDNEWLVCPSGDIEDDC